MIYRLPLLRSRHELDSWASREAAFLVNNWILLFAALFVLFATMFPTLSEAITGERLTVGPPFFNKWMTPIGLALLVLTGIAPLLAWRKSTISNLRFQFMWPVLTSVVTAVALVALGVRVWISGICFVHVRVRDRDDSPGVRQGRARAAGRHGHRPVHRAGGRRRPLEASLRRLHRAPRDRADLLRLCR